MAEPGLAGINTSLYTSLSDLCAASRQLALVCGIGSIVAFLVFGGVAYFAYGKYNSGKSKLWLAVAAVGAILAIILLLLGLFRLFLYFTETCS